MPIRGESVQLIDSQPEAHLAPEQQSVKVPEYDEAGLRELINSAQESVGLRESEILKSVDARVERAVASAGVDSQKALAIFEQRGFGQKIAAIKDGMRRLTSKTRETISLLFSSKPESLSLKNLYNPREVPAQTSAGEATAKNEQDSATSEEVQAGQATDGIQEQGEQAREILEAQNETVEQKEIRELYEYLEKEVFEKLGLSKEDEGLALAETSENNREVLRRSFENTRETLKARYELDCIEPGINQIGYEKEAERMKYEAMLPTVENAIQQIQPVLAEYGLEISPASLGFRKESVDLDNLWANTRKLQFDFESKIQAKVEAIIANALIKSGEYKGVTVLTEEQQRDHGFMARRSELLHRITVEEQRQLLEASGFEAWRDQLDQNLRNLIPSLPRPDIYDYRSAKRSREEVTRELESGVEQARSTGFLCLNISARKLSKVLESGGFKDINALSQEDKEEMQRLTGRAGDSSYLDQRRITEEALGTRGKSIIYGTYASENGIDEKEGGASLYGSIFLKIKPREEMVFCEGDSMSGGTTSSLERKITKQKINIIDYARYARARQIETRHAPIAKAVLELERNRRQELSGEPLSCVDYIEAHLSNVSIDEIESINIPARYAKGEQVHSAGEDQSFNRSFVERLLSDPKWKDKIKIIPQ